MLDGNTGKVVTLQLFAPLLRPYFWPVFFVSCFGVYVYVLVGWLVGWFVGWLVCPSLAEVGGFHGPTTNQQFPHLDALFTHRPEAQDVHTCQGF